MKQSKLIVTILLSTITIIFSSCTITKDDGDWDPMKLTKQEITFNANGGVDSIRVKNYSVMWMSRVYEGESNNPTKEYRIINTAYQDAQVLNGDWFQASADIMPNKQNWAYIYVNKNTSGKDRQLTITLTCGDIFNNISVKQSADIK